jgi:hypothetical protein
MKTISVLALLAVSCLAQTCYDGNLYLFTENSEVYQSNSNNASINDVGFDTNCSPTAVANAGDNIILSCYDTTNNYAKTIKTISENKVVSSISYNTICGVNPVAYDSKNGKLGHFFLS